MKARRIFLYTTLLGTCSIPAVGYTQATGAATVELEEIVVTANKRVETVQSVAGAIVAVDPSTLARSGVKDFENIDKVLPDVKVDTVIGGTNIAVRGIRSNSVSPTTDGPVAVHIDGVYLVRTGGVSGLMYDLQRIESLPGPQGTLYGRNATSGVINLIPNHPSDVAGGSIEVEGGSYTTQRMDGMINVPVNDMIAVRAAAHMYRRDGYFANGTGDADQTGARLSARFKFTDALTLLVSGDYESNKDHGGGQAVVGSVQGSPPQGPPPPAPQPPPAQPPGTYAIPADPFRDNRILYPLGTGTSGNSSTLHGVMAQLDYDFGWSVLSAQYGARTTSLLSDNVSLSTYNPDNPTGRGALPTAVGHVISPSHSSTDSAEVRLASKDTQQIKYVGGLFYFHESASSKFCQAGSLAVTTISPANCSLNINTPYQFTRSYSAFGDVTYTPSFLEALHLTGGVRYNKDNKSGNAQIVTAPPFPGGPSLNLNKTVTDLKFSKTTYKANVSYDITSSNMVYAQYSTGFRAGGIAYGSSPVYKPENIKAIEIGSKNRFLNDRLQVNLTAFDYKYTDVLGNVISFGPGGLSDLTVINIGAVHYQGASILTAYALTSDDRIDLNLQFLKGKYDSYLLPAQFVSTAPLNQNGQPTGENGSNLTGLDVPNIAPWSGTVGYEHTFHVGGGKLDARVASQFSAETHAGALPNFKDSIQYSTSRIPSYARFDVSLGYEPENGPWYVTGYVNNVTDKVTYSTVGYEGQTVASSGLVVAGVLPPRTYGVIVGTKF